MSELRTHLAHDRRAQAYILTILFSLTGMSFLHDRSAR